MTERQLQEARVACLTAVKQRFQQQEDTRLGHDAEDVIRDYIEAWFNLPRGNLGPVQDKDRFIFLFDLRHRRQNLPVPGLTGQRCRELLEIVDSICQDHLVDYRQRHSPSRSPSRTASPVRRSPTRALSPFALLPAQAVREALVDSLPLIPRQSDNLNLFLVIRHTNLSLTPLRPKTFHNEKGI